MARSFVMFIDMTRAITETNVVYFPLRPCQADSGTPGGPEAIGKIVNRLLDKLAPIAGSRDEGREGRGLEYPSRLSPAGPRRSEGNGKAPERDGSASSGEVETRGEPVVSGGRK